MVFRMRKLVKPEDTNPRGTLFGGRLLQWVDEEAAIFVMCQLETNSIVTKMISEINFISPGFSGDVIEIGLEVTDLGRTSITLKCIVRNKNTKKEIVTIDKIVFVCVGADGHSAPHGITQTKSE